MPPEVDLLTVRYSLYHCQSQCVSNSYQPYGPLGTIDDDHEVPERFDCFDDDHAVMIVVKAIDDDH
jgi:hypothetical protein